MSGEIVARNLCTRFWLQDVVYLRTCETKLPGMITAVHVRPNGVSYAVTWGSGGESFHYDFELSTVFVPEWVQSTEGGSIDVEDKP